MYQCKDLQLAFVCVHVLHKLRVFTLNIYFLFNQLVNFFLNSGSIAVVGTNSESVWPIFANDVNCTGDEESIWDCPQNGIAGYVCNHRQDASVICYGKACLINRSELSLAFPLNIVLVLNLDSVNKNISIP